MHRPIIRSTHMRIRVTKGDIEAGVQGNSFRCPVALAVRRAFKADEVWVREIIIVTKGRLQRACVAPPEVEDFIELYDSAILEFESPKPFSFTLDSGGRDSNSRIAESYNSIKSSTSSGAT